MMIGGLVEHRRGQEAYELLTQMQRKGLEPDAFMYASMLNLYSSRGSSVGRRLTIDSHRDRGSGMGEGGLKFCPQSRTSVSFLCGQCVGSHVC